VVANTVLTTPTFGDYTGFSGTIGPSFPKAVYDPINNKLAIFYLGTSAYAYAIVGTVTGTTITFGTAVIFRSVAVGGVAATFDSANQKFVVMLTYSGARASEAYVATVTGTAISFGSTGNVEAETNTNFPTLVYDSVNGKVVAVYQSSSPGKAAVGTVSGTSISFGTPVTFESSDTTVMTAAFDSVNGKVVIAYRDGNNSNYGTAIIGTVSGTSISFGTPVVFKTAITYQISIAYSPTINKVVLFYSNQSTGHGFAIVGTVSGTSISFGAEATVLADEIGSNQIVYDASADRFLIVYKDVNNASFNSASIARIGIVSGTSISFGTATLWALPNSFPASMVHDSATEAVIIAYVDAGNTGYGRALISQQVTTNLLSNNFIGFSQSSYTNGQTATIQTIGSVNTSQTSLTRSRNYYIRKYGDIGLVPSNPPVYAGLSLDTTKIIIKG
jgi:hypothetical protein